MVKLHTRWTPIDSRSLLLLFLSFAIFAKAKRLEKKYLFAVVKKLESSFTSPANISQATRCQPFTLHSRWKTIFDFIIQITQHLIFSRLQQRRWNFLEHGIYQFEIVLFTPAIHQTVNNFEFHEIFSPFKIFCEKASHVKGRKIKHRYLQMTKDKNYIPA